MRRGLKKLFDFVYEAIFFAPISTYVVLSGFLAACLGLIVARDYDSTDFGFAIVPLVMYFLVVNALLVTLLVWRSADSGWFRTVTRKLFIGSMLLIIPLLALGFVDYNYQLNKEIKQRNQWVADNEMYAVDPDKRFDYSVPESWIKTDEQLRRDVFKDSFSYLVVLAMPVLLVVGPLVAIRLIRRKHPS